MNWKDYIKSIQDSGIVDGPLESIMTRLFDIAGCNAVALNSETVKSWIYGRRNCKSSIYFPEGTIRADAVFRYFRNRPDDKLQALQRKFADQIPLNSGSPIDVKTTDLDIFCWSLVNQFLDLLKFERVDIPQSKDDTIDGIKELFPHDHKCCLYCIRWSGNKSLVGVAKMPIDGTCWKHRGNRDYIFRSLSSTAACADYRADQKRINMMKEFGYDVTDFI